MPAMLVMSDIPSSSACPSASVDVVGKQSACSVGINYRNGAAFDFDTYLLSASPPGFEVLAKCQYSNDAISPPLLPSSSYSIEPYGVLAESAVEARRRRFYPSSATSVASSPVSPTSSISPTMTMTTTATTSPASSSAAAETTGVPSVALSATGERNWWSSSALCRMDHIRTKMEEPSVNGEFPSSVDEYENGFSTSYGLTLSSKRGWCVCCGGRGGNSTWRSKSMSSATRDPRSVRFADEVGKLLGKVRVFTESPDTPPDIASHVIQRHRQAADDDLRLTTDFKMPQDNWSRFVERVGKNCVSLGSVRLHNRTVIDGSAEAKGSDDAPLMEYHLSGTATVKNLGFEKKVFVRFTFDDWASSIDIPANYIRSEAALTSSYSSRNCMRREQSSEMSLDVFEFSIEVPQSVISAGSKDDGLEVAVQMAVCFELPGADGRSFWDNDNGRNYRMKIQQRSANDTKSEANFGVRPLHERVRKTGVGWSVTSEYASWNRIDLTHPYW